MSSPSTDRSLDQLHVNDLTLVKLPGSFDTSCLLVEPDEISNSHVVGLKFVLGHMAAPRDFRQVGGVGRAVGLSGCRAVGLKDDSIDKLSRKSIGR